MTGVVRLERVCNEDGRGWSGSPSPTSGRRTYENDHTRNLVTLRVNVDYLNEKVVTRVRPNQENVFKSPGPSSGMMT